MIQIIEENKRRKPSFAESILGGIAENVGPAIQQYQQQKQQAQKMQQENAAFQQLTGMDISGIQDPKIREKAFELAISGQQEEKMLGKTQGFISELFGGQPSQRQKRDISGVEQQEPSDMQDMGQQEGLPSGLNAADLPDEIIAQASVVDPNLGRSLQHAKDVALREQRELRKAEQKKFEAERAYHTGFSKEAEKEVETIRASITKKEMALDFARNAIESGNLEYFSPDKLADITGSDLFRTAKGAQLVTAGKENLLSNMGRVSAKAQNIWFEQRLNSMFTKIGQSDEANLTVQEMLEGELELDKAYVNEFDRLVAADEEKYGFERKDISKRARDSVKPLEKEILKRTTYRMKEIEEQERGLSGLKKEVGKNVVKGTPLTLAMAKLYKDKFGENALKVAEKNGYYIPTLEEFKIFQQRPQEHREQLSQ